MKNERLEVFFEVLEGPATIEGNVVTLTGNPGQVVIEATQPGNGTYDPADPVTNTFMVLDQTTYVPEIDLRSPLQGDVMAPDLGYVQLAAICTIGYPDLFSVATVEFSINGLSFEPTDWGEGYYSGWWPAPDYGNYTLTITASNNYGYAAVETVNINVTQDVQDEEVLAVDQVWLNPGTPSVLVDAELPSYVGAYGQITGTLELECPSGGCGEWDRVGSIDVRGHNGDWIQIIRYITPYGVPCIHSIDLTDYMSLLEGKVTFRVNCGTLDNGYLWSLTLNFNEGNPPHDYSTVKNIWWDIYDFGNLSNLQPVEDVNYTFPENAEASTLKLVSTGHGWGETNTGNAAEFYEATHHIWVNGEETFEQYNWYDCNPNPDGCQPQNGTWFYDRAGWCPGAIAQWFDYDFTSFIQEQDIQIGYVFYEEYVDYCNPNNPDCVTGVTCSDCNAGFNPMLDVACNLVVFADSPIDDGVVVSIDDDFENLTPYISLYPNPTHGSMDLSLNGKAGFDNAVVSVGDLAGNIYRQFYWNGETTTMNLSSLPKGVYYVKIDINGNIDVHKIVIQ